ncbi:MAG: DDE-type integrase/transposase/recombinase [Anaerolineae bacterium]|nr:DDE-type integrase/transposase/recombinase [Anaerolineae bacterium]
MPATRATTIQQRQAIANLRAEGQSYQVIAAQLNLSLWTVRKWARQAKGGGLAGLVSAMGRPLTGPMAETNPRVRYVALRLKRQHPSWGAAYILKKMKERASLKGLSLPEATTLWRYWRSFGDRLWPKRQPTEAKLPQAGVAHGVWQMDAKESVPVAGVGVVTIHQARDEFGRATVIHRVHPASAPEQRVVKLTTEQVQQDCRIAFSQWGLPDAVQTDRAPIFLDKDPTPYPTRLALWWIGLGIEPRLIPRHTPKRNGAVERSHRTLDERTLSHQQFDGVDHLQRQIDADWHELNTECPSRAKGCGGQPPLLAHPELLCPRRPYHPEWEAALFDLNRVEAYLAHQNWLRVVSQVGQVSLGGYRYGLGLAWAGQTVTIQFEPSAHQFVFTPLHPQNNRRRPQLELGPIRLVAKGLSIEELTGLPLTLTELPTRQLMLPLLMYDPEPIEQGV